MTGQLPAWTCGPGQFGGPHRNRNTDSPGVSDSLFDDDWSLSGRVSGIDGGIYFADFRIGVDNPVVDSTIHLFGVFLFCLLRVA